eukprot:11869-Heterococcus_DN1.PRE.1
MFARGWCSFADGSTVAQHSFKSLIVSVSACAPYAAESGRPSHTAEDTLGVSSSCMSAGDPYALLQRAVDEVALEGPQGCNLARLWDLLDLQDVYLQRWVWKCLFQDAGFE